MKIAIDARELRSSTGRYIERLIHYLQEIDTKNEYVILLQPKDMDGWLPSAVNFSKVPCPHKEFTFDEQLGFLKQLNGIGADIVHFGMVQQPVLYKGKVVTTMHDLTTTRFRNPTKNAVIFVIKQAVYKWVNKRVAHKSNHVITPTLYVKNDIVDYASISPDKISVTYEAADKFSAEPSAIHELKGKDFIFYVGRAQPHKNLARLLEAYGLLHKQNPNLYLVYAGKRSGNYEELETLASQSPANSNIIFTDFVSEGELRWLYENARAYVFPSLSEGFGLPGLEAMVHGCPVVSSNATCLPEVYGGAAVYFKPNDAQDMAGKISSVISDEKLRKSLIKLGHEQAGKYSWRRMAKETLAIYESINPQA